MMGITVYRCQQIKENNWEQSTVFYVISVHSLKPATLRDTLTASQWSGMCFFLWHLYGNAVRFFAGYRLLHCMESIKWKCQRSRISQSSADCPVKFSIFSLCPGVAIPIRFNLSAILGLLTPIMYH